MATRKDFKFSDANATSADDVKKGITDIVNEANGDTPGTSDLAAVLKANAAPDPEIAGRSMADATEKPTTEFDDKETAGSKKKEPTRETFMRTARSRKDRENNEALYEKLGNPGMNLNERNFRVTMSKTCKIACYFCNKGEHTDVVATKSADQNDTSYDFRVKQYGPSPIKMVLIMVPSILCKYMNCNPEVYTTKECIDDVNTVANESEHAYTPIFVSWSDMTVWIRSHTYGYVIEDANLFVPYYSKENGALVKRTFDHRGKSKCTVSDSCLYIKVVARTHTKIKENGDKDTTRVPALVVVHNYRQRILAPGNYVAMNTYEDVNIGKNYSQEEAQTFINQYLAKFTKVPTSKQNTVQRSKAAQISKAERLHTNYDGTNIIASWLFPVGDGESYFDRAENKICHWCNKTLVSSTDETGKQITDLERETLPVNVLSKKQERKTDTNSGSGSYTFVLHGLGDSHNPFTKEHYPNVFAAITSKRANIVQPATSDDLPFDIDNIKGDFDKCVKASSKGKNKSAFDTSFDPSKLIGGDEDLFSILNDSRFVYTDPSKDDIDKVEHDYYEEQKRKAAKKAEAAKKAGEAVSA